MIPEGNTMWLQFRATYDSYARTAMYVAKRGKPPAMILETHVVHECDNPKCHTQAIQDVDGDPPWGLTGTVTEVQIGGARGVEFFACRIECLRPAVEALLHE